MLVVISHDHNPNSGIIDGDVAVCNVVNVATSSWSGLYSDGTACALDMNVLNSDVCNATRHLTDYGYSGTA